MSPECSNLDPFLDGELAADAAAEFQGHLASCERCQRVLRGRMQEEMITDAADPHAAHAASPAPAPRRLLYLAPILAAAAAVAIWMVGTRGTAPSAAIDLAVAIDHSGPATRSGATHVGDVVRLLVRGAGHRALWVYRGDRELVAACPGGATCAGDEHQATLELRLGAPGSYSVIAIVSPQPIAQPQGAVDVMLSAVTATGAHVKITPIEVN